MLKRSLYDVVLGTIVIVWGCRGSVADRLGTCGRHTPRYVSMPQDLWDSGRVGDGQPFGLERLPRWTARRRKVHSTRRVPGRCVCCSSSCHGAWYLYRLRSLFSSSFSSTRFTIANVKHASRYASGL